MIRFPSYRELIDRSRGDIAKNLPGVDPTVHGSFVRALADVLSGRAYDLTILQQQVLQQLMPTLSGGEYLEQWAAYEGLTRNPATGSSGPATVTGTAGATLASGTELTTSTGGTYVIQDGVTLAARFLLLSSLSRSGSTVTGVTSSSHGLATGMTVTISGADQVQYNGVYAITVTSETQFTYTLVGTLPATPATGTIYASYIGAEIDLESSGTGPGVNLDSGATLTLATPVSGVDTTVRVQFSGISGAVDTETDTELRARVLQSRSNPVANFNEAAIVKAALAVPGVTRVKVKRVTPEIGDVTILFVRDNDPITIIPSSTEVQAVFDAVFAIAPANTAESSVIVQAPTPVTTNYIFTALSPDSATMRDAITANLAAFYADEVDFGVNISEDKYRAAIINTVDPSTGDTLESFTLSNPTGDISVSTNGIGILGSITYP